MVGEVNDLIRNKALKSRCDYVFTWRKLLDDKLSMSNSMAPSISCSLLALMPLSCDSAVVTCIADTTDTQRSTHFGVACTFEI
jgi:hypothetical protein